MNNDPEELSDEDLLEMTMSFVAPNGDPRVLAEGLFEQFGSFAAAMSAPTADLLQNLDWDEAKTAVLKLIRLASVRLAKAELAEQPVLSNWTRLIDYLMAAMSRDPREQLRVLFLNSRDSLICDEVLSRGTVNHTPIYVREIMRRAIETQSAALVLSHNHPSGDARPSRDDIRMTRQIVYAAELLGIPVHDHVIVSKGGAFSFRNEGLL